MEVPDMGDTEQSDPNAFIISLMVRSLANIISLMLDH
jgi:hypothetical protein